MRRLQQQGQAIVLFALLSIVLVGFVGLVIDGGEVAAQQQLVQSAADGSALAGGYGVAQPGATVGSATTLAQNVLRNLGLATGDLSIAFLDAGGGATTTPAAVKTVQATVSDSKPTFFLKVLGVNSTQVSARASAAAGAVQGCVLCVLGSGTTVVEGVGAGITVSGGSAVIDSTASPNLLLNDNAHFSATSVTIVGGGYQLGQSATITPVPALGNAVADPFAALPVPSVGGARAVLQSTA